MNDQKKVSSEEMTSLPKIAAVDFDGTLAVTEFPRIVCKNEYMFQLCNVLKSFGVKLILWTSRDGDQLTEAVDYCRQNGLDFDAVNANLPEVITMFHNDTRKVYADIYIDDKAIPHIQDPLYWVDRLGIARDDFTVMSRLW